MGSDKATATQIQELIDLVKAYFKQETVGPLKTMGRRVGLGVGGSLLIGMSAVFFSVGALRLIAGLLPATQSGLLSMLPYLGAALVLGLICAFLWNKIQK